MTSLVELSRPQPSPPPSGRSCRPLVAVLLVVTVLAVGAGLVVAHRVRGADLRRSYLGADGWPTAGQAAYRVGDVSRAGPRQDPAPIASLAKVMTAYLVLQRLPLRADSQGPGYVITPADVEDYRLCRGRGESVVRVVAGERITERQALAALLLPSANNMAALLARHVAGSTAEFVRRMNATARRLGMVRTNYSDPSGFDPSTVSTAADQVILAAAVADDPVFADLVSRTSYPVPVVGVVRSTDTLLGHDGFTETKTGSDDAAGGCFMFRTTRVVGGRISEVLGVVLGQHGRHDITAGLQAARQLADRVGPAARG